MEIIKKFEPLFGEWYAESFIGSGSFGRVYKICREEFGERFYSALKYISIPVEKNEIIQLRMDGMDDESISTYYTELTKSISAETRLMNKLRGHTNIVSFEDSKVVPKPEGIGYDIFIRMELLTGLPTKMLSSPLSVDDTVKLGSDICGALAFCGKFGIIHRDIKPDNIFVSPAGDYKLGDFGIARTLEKTSAFMSKKGTYNYMAPEVYRGEAYGSGCDIYSLGIVMYRLLNNGRLPFMPPAPQSILPEDRENSIVRRMAGEPLPPPCCADPDLAAIVLKACAFDPKERYASPREMADALEEYRRAERHPDAPAPTDGYEVTVGVTPVGTEKYCPHCGCKMPAKALFCPECGGNVNAVKEEKKADGPANKGEKPVRETEASGNKIKKSKAWIIAAAAGGAVFLAGLLLLISALGAFDKKYSLSDIFVTDPKVEFNDSAFEEAFRKAYGFEDVVRESDILGVTELELPSKGLTDISDIAKFRNLTSLDIGNNKITDYSVLGELPKLQKLSAARSGISDCAPFAELEGLTYLDLGQNNIADVGALGGLTDLNYLDLRWNKIADISALNVLTKLETLLLSTNKINDVSAVEGLRNLRILNLSYNKLKDISPMSGLTEMEELDLSDNYIADITALGAMSKLKRLDLSHNKIADISALGELAEMEVLGLGANLIVDVSSLSGMKGITALDLSSNKIKSIAALAELTQLETLDLSANSISNVSSLGGLPELKTLNLSGNAIYNITDLGNCKSLTELRLFGNPLSSGRIDALRKKLPNCSIYYG